MAERTVKFNRRDLRKRRRSIRLTCDQLGLLAGCHGSTVACIEGGRIAPSIEMAEALQAALEKAKADKEAAGGVKPESIRPRRILLGRTQEQLADDAGVSKRTIWKIEQCQATRPGGRVDVGPKRATLDAIDAALRAAEAQPPVNVAADLRAAREKAGQRQKDLAHLAGISEHSLQFIEGGRSNPKPDTLKKLGAALEQLPPITSASNVRQRRLELRLTRQELADRAGISLTTVSQVEQRKGCFLTTLVKIHKALDIAAKERASANLPSGNELRRKREAADMTRSELARRVNISWQPVWRLEEGRGSARICTLRAIEKALQDPARNRSETDGKKTGKLYAEASRSAKARWRKTKLEHEQRPLAPESVVLNDTEWELLDGLYHFKAFRPEVCARIADIAEKRRLNEGTLSKVVARLKKDSLRLVDSKKGPGGGCWLTAAGKDFCEMPRR